MDINPDPRAVALELEAWGIIQNAVDEILPEMLAAIDEHGIEAVIRHVIDNGTSIELVAALALVRAPAEIQVTAEVIKDIDGPGKLIAAFDARAKTLFRAVLHEGEAVGHIHHANGHTRLT